MLVLSRKTSESIVIDNNITIRVVEISGSQVRLGVVAPQNVRVMREELIPSGTNQSEYSNLESPRLETEPQGEPEWESEDLMSRIRQAILHRPESLNQLSTLCGIDRGRLSRFLRGERDLTLTAASKLCEVLGLKLISCPASSSAAQ